MNVNTHLQSAMYRSDIMFIIIVGTKSQCFMNSPPVDVLPSSSAQNFGLTSVPLFLLFKVYVSLPIKKLESS